MQHNFKRLESKFQANAFTGMASKSLMCTSLSCFSFIGPDTVTVRDSKSASSGSRRINRWGATPVLTQVWVATLLFSISFCSKSIDWHPSSKVRAREHALENGGARCKNYWMGLNDFVAYLPCISCGWIFNNHPGHNKAAKKIKINKIK